MQPQRVGVKFKRLPEGAGLPLPRRHSAHAAGLDLAAAVAEPLSLPSGRIEVVPCGFAMAIPVGYEAQVRPRSGLASRHGVTLVNSPGTIDADYRGQVCVPLINLGPEPFTIERGMRIAQMVIQAVPIPDWQEVDELPPSVRGEQGFGHTGI
jgi:dUTP pyrophosphatase